MPSKKDSRGGDKMIDIELNSQQNGSGLWKPRTTIFIHEGNQTRCIPWEWVDQEFESKDVADLHASSQAKHFLRIKGYKEEIFVLPNQTKKD